MFGLRVRPTFKTEVRAELGLLFERTSAEVSEVLVKKLKTPRFKRGVGNKSTFENFLSTVVHRLGNHLSQPKSYVPIVKIRFLLCAGERAKVRENVNKKYV